MVAPTTWLPQLYQRFQPLWDRAVPSAGLALLLWACAEATGAYPREWRLFLAACLFMLGMAWSGVAYTAFTFFIAYPLYSISIYLAAIVLAVLILTSHWAMRNLGTTVLVLITPVLLPLHLEATVPLLAGLWWGEHIGALAGGLAALWLKLLAGMSGQPLELSKLSGWMPAGANIIERFSGFNSLQTLLELVNPFGRTSQALLLHVLQVLAWILAGYIVGRLTRRTWSDRWRGWAPLISVMPASAIIWVSYVRLPGILDRPSMELLIPLRDLTLWLLLSALMAALVRMSYLYLRRPLFRPLRQRPQRLGLSGRVEGLSRNSAFLFRRKEQRSKSGGTVPAFNWVPNQRSQPSSETDDDVIMLEID